MKLGWQNGGSIGGLRGGSGLSWSICRLREQEGLILAAIVTVEISTVLRRCRDLRFGVAFSSYRGSPSF